MKNSIIANRYAQAFFDHSNDAQKLKAVAEDLVALSDFLVQSTELSEFLKHPAIPQKKREAVLKEIFSDKINTTTLNFLIFLEQKKRLYLFKDICQSFKKIYNDFNQIQNITITTATPLSQDQISRIEDKWKSKLDRDIRSHIIEDTNLLGGLRIQINDEIHDYTIDNKLKRFKESILT